MTASIRTPLRLAELPPGPIRACAVHLATNHDTAALRAMQRSPVLAGELDRWKLVPAEWRTAVTAALGEQRALADELRERHGQAVTRVTP